jgi:hypothetical protein
MTVEAYFGEAYEAGRRGYRNNLSLAELPYERFPDPADKEMMIKAWRHEDAMLSGGISPFSSRVAEAESEPSSPTP